MIKPLAKSVLIPLGFTAAASAADAGIHKKILGSGNHLLRDCPSSSASHNTVLIISNDEIENIIKIVKSLEDSGLLLKRVAETVQNEVKEQKGEFLSMLLGTIGASLLGNLLIGKGATATSQERVIHRAGKGKGKRINRAGEGVLRAEYGCPLSSALQNNNNRMDF